MSKKIINKKELQPKIIEGMEEIASIVKRTLGPGGLPIMIERSGQAQDGSPLSPRITKDGVSVANECFSDDPEKDLVIQSVKAICRKTNRVAGDGTTTAIVLGEAILKETLDYLERNPSLNPQLVKEEVEVAAKEVILKLEESALPLDNMDLIKQVATISANGDEEIGDILCEAFKEVGAEGVVTVDEGHTNKLSLEVVEGYQFQRGAESRENFFNNKDLTKFEADNAVVLINDGDLNSYTDLLPALQAVANKGPDGVPISMPPVVIIANNFGAEVIQFLKIQKQAAGMQLVAVKGPNVTHVRSGHYDDMAVLFGGHRFGNGNRNLSTFQPGDEGLVGKVLVDKYTTTFYDGQGCEEAVMERVEQLQGQKAVAESPYDKQIVADRLAALTGGIAKIGVGGATEFEIKEKYDRIEDALNASRAAIEKGIVPGGGATLYRLSEEVDSPILKRALKAPFYQILENIGVEPHEMIVHGILINKQSSFNARSKHLVPNAVDAGIVDPVKVTIAGLENAVSIASLLSTAGGGIIFKKKEQA